MMIFTRIMLAKFTVVCCILFSVLYGNALAEDSVNSDDNDEITKNNGMSESNFQEETSKETNLSTMSTIDPSTTTTDDNNQVKQPQSISSKNSTPRLITKEELASMNGKGPGNTMWLSILSEVFDVTVSPHFYAENRSYNIFVGRDANVPFVTGIFTEEEAAKSVLTLEDRQIYSIEQFLNETYKDHPVKYPFVGYLIGDLYDENGNPTETLRKVRTIIEQEKQVLAEQERQSEAIRAQWDLEEKERRLKKKYRRNRSILQTIRDFFKGEL